MTRTLKRLLLAAVLASAGSSAHAGSCGIGTIHTVMIGAWNWQGIHIIMNHEAGTAPPTSSFWSTNKIRFMKSGFNDVNFRTIKAVLLLAYANGNRIQVTAPNITGTDKPNCALANEIHLMP